MDSVKLYTLIHARLDSAVRLAPGAVASGGAMTSFSLLAPALAWSHVLRWHLESHPGDDAWLAEAAAQPVDRARIEHWLAECGVEPAHPQAPTIESCRVAVRRLRRRVFHVLMVRDLAGLASLEEVIEAMSDLADIAVAEAYRAVANKLAAGHGIPLDPHTGKPQELLMIGMGKLGGRELNVSSDIDLVMLYGSEGETTGRRPISHHEFYAQVTRRMMPVLSEIDDLGQVFRTDLRLRPDGNSGPLAWSLDALEHYLISQGREWERYAWLKARWLPAQAFEGSDPRSQMEQVEALRRPFVYRKYFDFDAIAALRGLRERIRDDWNRRSLGVGRPEPVPPDNIKLGEGGIREIEFIVQLTQLVRGGRMPALQHANLLKALAAQHQAGLLSSSDAQQLEAAYRFLRRLEHMLQYREDQQTHQLPRQAEARDALAEAMQMPDVQTLDRTLRSHREFVVSRFRDVFRLAGLQRETAAGSARTGAGSNDHSVEPEGLDLEQLIRDTLPGEADELLRRVQALLDSPRIRGLPESSRSRVDDLLPRMVEAAALTRAPAEALRRLLDLIEQIAQRRVYLSLLAEYPLTLARVARMMAASEWVAQYLTRNPLLLDSLIDWRALMEPLDFEQIGQQLVADLDQCLLPDGSPDIERQMNLMRDTQRRVSFHVLAQDLESNLSVEAVGDDLSLLADLLLEQSLARVWPLVAQDASQPPRFAVVAYGKLGGKELGYDSDLDLVFLFDDDGGASETYVRYARRIVSWLSSLTSSGRLYEVDLRLRPDGDAGLVAASVEAFERYQRESAWTWEHQALTRARFAAGDALLGERFERIRREVLLQERNSETLRADVLTMRERISAGHPNRTALFDVKHDRGGMVDVEFITQFLVLRHVREHPELLHNLGNIALLRLAGTAGLIPLDLAHEVGDAYRNLRREQHALRLQGADKARLAPERMAAEREAVLALWEHVFGADPAPASAAGLRSAP